MAFDADVIVAGAGPAGAVAARALASRGIDTLLIDRAEFPRNKPCGGGISMRAFHRFPWLATAIQGIDTHYVSKLHLEGPGGASLDVALREPCVLMIRRVEFDAALATAATAAGARFARFEITQAGEDALGVTLQARDGRRLRARAVIAADGVHSVLAKRLGVNRRWPRASVALDMMEETPEDTLRARDPEVLWVAYAFQGLDGYAYVFPKRRHVNVGIGCLLSHYDAAVTAHPYELQRSFVDALVERGELSGRSERGHFTPSLIPVGGPLPQTWSARALFAGDAGGFVNAVTAEGIFYAMVSGELAGRAVAESGRSAAGPRYHRLWRREIGAELRDAVFVQRYLFSDHDRVARIVRGAAHLPGFIDMILDHVAGRVSYGALRRRLLVRFPGTILKVARSRRPAPLPRAS
jgi:geranylgeranyl reductase family protein